MTKAFNLSEEMSFQPHEYVMDYARSLDDVLTQTIAQYDKYNIVKGLVSGQYSQEWANNVPTHFMNATRVNFGGDLDGQLSTFEEAITTGQSFALGELGLPYAGYRIDAEIMFPFYEICEKYGVPVLLHTGINGPFAVQNMPHWRITNGDPLHFESVLGSFPELNVVFAHFGYPFTNNTIYMLATYRNVHADISVLNWMLGKSLFHRIISEAVEAVGSNRILFGTDQMIFPNTIPISVENTLSLPIAENDIANIMYHSAKDLLNLDDI